MNGNIYYIKNKINDTYYIGQTSQLNKRWSHHKSDLNNNRHHNCLLQRDWNKYGEDNFEFKSVETCDVATLDDREQKWIKFFSSKNHVYNQCIGGKGIVGYEHSENEIFKMRHIQNPKSVLQLDKDLQIVHKWDSCSHAGKTLGLYIRGIRSCCERQNYQKTIGGLFWVYENDYNSPDFDFSYLKVSQMPKMVIKYDLDFNLLGIYKSATEAGKSINATGGQISSVCNKKRKTCKGFIFRYVDKYSVSDHQKDLLTDFKHSKTTSIKRKSVLQYSKKGDFLRQFESALIAEKQTGIKKEDIQYCCSGHCKTSGGFIWKYSV